LGHSGGGTFGRFAVAAGTTIIDYVAHHIEQDAALQELLQGVRQFDTADDVWERIKALRGDK
jgi:hypothetical protein